MNILENSAATDLRLQGGQIYSSLLRSSSRNATVKIIKSKSINLNKSLDTQVPKDTDWRMPNKRK